jgi:hypothetical protein
MATEPDPVQIVPGEDPVAQLERAFLTEFLELRGHTLESVRALPSEEMHALLKAAAIHAAGRLTEVETRAHYVHELHHVSDRR